MAVERYGGEEIHAALWRGKMADLAGMPDFNDLVEYVHHVSSDLLTLELEENTYTDLHPNEDYIVHSNVHGFYVLKKTTFEKVFTPFPREAERRRDAP